ncbi:ATP-dependent RNA helicase [Acrasis kona]|uniref:ATP-dependent RNA helicase n=1 Tax=Acrasis kona TaxID=1008807 RepID=A0AAW2ZLE7_9EUKA
MTGSKRTKPSQAKKTTTASKITKPSKTKQNSTSSKRTDYQKECSDKYKGNYETQASHYIPAKQREYFKLPNKNDGPSNYRNQNTITNQSVHTTIDNHLLGQSRKHSFVGGSLTTRCGINVPEKEIRDRVEKQIKVAKQTGDIKKKNYRTFLAKGAEAYGIDKRAFNGYK